MKVFDDFDEAFCESEVRPPNKYTAEEVEEILTAAMTYADLSEEQATVHRAVLDWYQKSLAGVHVQPVLTLGGLAGTGKTTLLGVLANTLSRSRVAYCALTGRAASILRKTLKRAGVSYPSVGTIHQLLYRKKEDKRTGALLGFTKADPEELRDMYDLIVIDEASMVDKEIASDLLEVGLPILAVGDHGQLPPINGASYWMADPDLRLEKIHRQAEESPIIHFATHIRTEQTLDGYKFDGQVVDWIKPEELQDRLMLAYEKYGPRDVGLLVYTNGLRKTLNELAHYLWTGQEPGQVPGANSWVICLKNNHMAGVMNGMRAYLEDSAHVHNEHWYRAKMYYPNEQLAVHADFLRYQFGRPGVFTDLVQVRDVCRAEDQPRWKQVGLLLDYGYAITVHKAQGSQFKHVFLVYERPMNTSKADFARWLYTGITRGSERVTVVWNG